MIEVKSNINTDGGCVIIISDGLKTELYINGKKIDYISSIEFSHLSPDELATIKYGGFVYNFIKGGEEREVE